MPEGPEVAINRDYLNSKIKNDTLLKIEFFGKNQKKYPKNSFDFEINLPAKLTEVKTKGKFLYFCFENGFFLHCSLGMTGIWSETKTEHCSVELIFEKTKIYFNDIRHFGSVSFTNDIDVHNKKLNSLGYDMLAAPPSDIQFKRALMRAKGKTIAEVIMSQNYISGVGNYIKSETLYLSKISPWRKVETLNDIELASLNKSIQSVISESYKANGTTLLTYKSGDGQSGRFVLQIYGKKSTPRGHQIIKEETADKRTTHWCKQEQF